eukprot:g2246.t1
MPWCNPTLAIDARVADMVSRMTLEEKIGCMDSNGYPIKGLGLKAYNFWSEASTGVANRGHKPTKVGSFSTTKFAFPITTGMSFNRSLWFTTGAQIGREARAMMNVGSSYSTFWAPVINLAREPRWGRNIETPGEDPYLTGQYAIHFTKGMQESPEDPSHIQASACCKHFVANSLESSYGPQDTSWNRENDDAAVTMQDLVDSYMLPFQASDCDADHDVIFKHHYLNHTPAQGVADVLHAGTDVDCGAFVSTYAQAALGNSTITEADLDERLAQQFRVRIRLGHFDPLGPLNLITPDSTICTDFAIETSIAGMVQSAALLKNLDKTLPLAPGTGAGTIAVIGPLANYSEANAGYYGPQNVCGMNYWTAIDAKCDAGIPAAVAMAKAVDSVILVVGTDLKTGSEGIDAKNISITDAQTTLIEQTAAAAKRPIVVLLLTAFPLDISALLSNPKVGAILHTGQPSVTIMGVAELLFGKTSPAGRTIQTIYPSSYQDQISAFPTPSDAVTAAAPLVQYAVNVTNSGSIDADDVVLGFLKPPGAGTGGVPLQTLFGFKRIHLQAGETKTVYLYPALTDFTQVDEQGARYVLPGRYTFAFGVAETAPHGMGYAEHVVQTSKMSDNEASESSLVVDLSLEGVPDPSTIHQLPCSIDHDGPAAVSTYFRVEDKPLRAHFRGRQLDGQRVALPADVQGAILKQGRAAPEDEIDRLLKVDCQFKEIIYWHHDKIMTEEDHIPQCMDWMDLSKELHSPIEA